MSALVNILSITGQSPYDVYVCDINGENCFYIDRIDVANYEFYIPSPNDKYNAYMLKIIDSNNSIISGITYVE
jgi:hypothetical protein